MCDKGCCKDKCYYNDKCCYESKCCYEELSCDPCKPCKSYKSCKPCKPIMTDCLAKEIECLWKKTFCDATIVPKIGTPSCSCGVLLLTHSLDKCICKIKINGLTVKSPLAKNSFLSSEVSEGKWVNLYQIQLPNIPGKCGCKSSGEVYNEALVKCGISIESDHYDWKGLCPSLISIHSKAIGMDPIEFSKKQIAAIKAVLEHFTDCCV